MKLLDRKTGLMACRVCKFQHYANVRPRSGGQYYRHAWMCKNGCQPGDRLKFPTPRQCVKCNRSVEPKVVAVDPEFSRVYDEIYCQWCSHGEEGKVRERRRAEAVTAICASAAR